MIRKLQVATLSFAAALGIAAVAQAAVSEPALSGASLEAPLTSADRQFDRWVAVGALSARYDELLKRARDLDAAPDAHVLRQPVATQKELRKGLDDLRGRIRDAREATSVPQPSGGMIEGVSLATLNTIAACESGGDPGAVNAAGYYGKYQFDQGTWASVGGSGNPAEASENEQDYRAALLYSQAGSSPWPVCGV